MSQSAKIQAANHRVASILGTPAAMVQTALSIICSVDFYGAMEYTGYTVTTRDENGTVMGRTEYGTIEEAMRAAAGIAASQPNVSLDPNTANYLEHVMNIHPETVSPAIEDILSSDSEFNHILADDIELADIEDREERIEAAIMDITENYRDDTRNQHSKLITRLMNAYDYRGKRTPLRKRILDAWYWDNHGDGNVGGLY